MFGPTITPNLAPIILVVVFILIGASICIYV
jgi:hypothetical protein